MVLSLLPTVQALDCICMLSLIQIFILWDNKIMKVNKNVCCISILIFVSNQWIFVFSCCVLTGPAINGHTINSNFSCNSDDINEIIKKSDALLKDYKYDELCTLLSAYKQVENAELLWRLAEAYCARAKLEGEKGHDHRRRELMEEGFTFAQRALKLDENNSRCHSVSVRC